MCGRAGYLRSMATGITSQSRRMGEAITHRGPDGEGLFAMALWGC